MEQIDTDKKIDLQKYKLNKKVFFLEKLNHSNSQKKFIQSKIREYFFSPENYFNENSSVLINKKIKIKKITPIEHLSSNIKKKIVKSNTYKEKVLSNSNINRESSLDKESQNKHFEKINKEKLKDIFNSYKSAKPIRKKDLLSNNHKQNNSYNCNIPMQLSIDLDSQARKLNEINKVEKKSRQLSKYLSRKLHIKENSLLINNIYPYTYKKQILEKENSKNDFNFINQNYLFKWVSSLRKPKIFEGKMKSYINVGNTINPLWSIHIEKFPDTKEITYKSGINSEIGNKDEKDGINSYKFKSFGDLEKISVTGKNLYNIEYKREMSSNCNRILHKSFVDNGKVIMYKDVNNLFGHKTIYKNYSGRNKKEYTGVHLGSQSMQNLSKF